MKNKFCNLALILTLLTAIIFGLTGCEGVVTGSGKLETRVMDYSGFTEIEISHSITAEITYSDRYSVSLTADDNLFEYITVTHSVGKLTIRMKDRYMYTRSTQRVVITLPDLRKITLSGATRAEVGGFNSNNTFKANVSGASSLTIDNIVAGDTDIIISGASKASGGLVMNNGRLEASGASSLDLDGSAGNIKLYISGASSGRLAEFACRNIEANISGASNAAVNLNGRLDADVSGASRLTYTGNPTLGRTNTSGASSISVGK